MSKNENQDNNLPGISSNISMPLKHLATVDKPVTFVSVKGDIVFYRRSGNICFIKGCYTTNKVSEIEFLTKHEGIRKET